MNEDFLDSFELISSNSYITNYFKPIETKKKEKPKIHKKEPNPENDYKNIININDLVRNLSKDKKSKGIKRANSIENRISFKILNEIEQIPNDEQNPNFKENCFLYIQGKNTFESTVTIKNFVLSFDLSNYKKKVLYNKSYYSFSLLSINKYEKRSLLGYTKVEIQTKDYRTFKFKLLTQHFNKFNIILDEYAFPSNTLGFYEYATWFKKQNKSINYSYINGWDIYSISREFTRQKVEFGKKNSRYRLLDNSKFDICSTYPSQVIIPSCITTNDISLCSKFRTKNRFPALTYQYSKNKHCIWRSSQTLSGVTSQKCEQDIDLLTKISDIGKKLFIFDARPYLNAMANVFKGAGFENKKHYQKIDVEIIFCDMSNIHSVRSVLGKLYSTVVYNNENKNYFTNIDNSLWYSYINSLIKSSIEIALAIKKDCTVLVHCSDGWDRTTQLCATSQILLDSYYRTLEGFIVLIEKDWLSFGHQFGLRCGLYSSKYGTWTTINNEDQRSPIFIQWLDAIYQIVIQNYSMFEFNIDLLLFLAIEVYEGRYGTFLFNSEKERFNAKAKSSTESIWTYVIRNKEKFINPIYNEIESKNEEIIYKYKKVHLWEEYFYYYENKVTITSQYLNVFKQIISLIPENEKSFINISPDALKYIEKISPNLDIKMSRPFEIMSYPIENKKKLNDEHFKVENFGISPTNFQDDYFS